MGDDRRSAEAEGWRVWYRTARWKRLRWAVLVRDLFTCQMCGAVVADTSKLVADHKKAHKGDEGRFFDENNVQCLCKPCHDSAKQSAERGRKVAVGADGWPLEA